MTGVALTLASVFANVLMVVGVLILLFIVVVNVRRKSMDVGALDPREKIERDRQKRGTRDDLRTMMVELDELTRQFSAQLDAKSVKLEQLIREADQRIAQLEGRTPSPRDSTPEQSPVEAPAERRSSLIPNPDDDPLTTRVYELADAGHDATQISRKLDEHIGKIELILALRQHS